MKPRLLISTLLALLLVLTMAPLTGATAQDGPEADIFGQITDAATGDPIAEATVTLLVYPEGPGGPGATGQDVTDEDGNYAFFDVDRASFVLVEAEGYADNASEDFDYRSGDDPVEADVALFPEGDPHVLVTVVGAVSGDPLAQAHVWATYVDDDSAAAPIQQVGDDGRAEFYLQTDRDFVVTAVLSGYAEATSTVLTYDGADPVEVVVELDARFTDVQPDHLYFWQIGIIADMQITLGYPDGTYAPGSSVVRGQMAAFLLRSMRHVYPEDDFGWDGAATGFSDVPTTHTHAHPIAVIADREVTLGYDDGTFRPGSQVTRGQMATFLQRAFDLEVLEHEFTDVPADHPHADGIGAVSNAISGYEDGTFRPENPVTRGQMAVFIIGTLRGLG